MGTRSFPDLPQPLWTFLVARLLPPIVRQAVLSARLLARARYKVERRTEAQIRVGVI